MAEDGQKNMVGGTGQFVRSLIPEINKVDLSCSAV